VSGTYAALDPVDRQWLALEGVDLADERVIVVRPAPGTIGFDVATARGIVLIRYDGDAVGIRGARWVGGQLEFPPDALNMDTFGRPWTVVAGPDNLVGTRCATAGEATRAALRGWPWPDGWGRDFEQLHTSPSDPPVPVAEEQS
jgi:hypothetical protein